jgi:hypothetical protein
MRLRNVVWLVVVLVVVAVVGIAIQRHRNARPESTSAAAQTEQPAKPLNAPVAAEPQEHVARPKSRTAALPSVPPSAPGLQKALKPVLNRGTNMSKAADGFQSGMQFAAVAYASKNTSVPFVVLKHRVLTEKKTLAAAIHASKPDVNAKREATRAWDEARREVSQL